MEITLKVKINSKFICEIFTIGTSVIAIMEFIQKFMR